MKIIIFTSNNWVKDSLILGRRSLLVNVGVSCGRRRGDDGGLTGDSVHVEHGGGSFSGLPDVSLHELPSKHLSVVLVLCLRAGQRHVQRQRVVPEVHKPATTDT